MEFRYLNGLPFSSVHTAFVNVFSDYLIPMKPSEAQLRDMFQRRGADPKISVGAFDGDQLVGFNWNALDHYNGALSVYDVATGVVPSHRRKGVAGQLFEFSLPKLKETGAQRYVLEVFEQNARAMALYEKTGFRQIRVLKCFRELSPPLDAEISAFQIQAIQPEWDTLSSFWDWQPSWQNSIRSIQRSQSPHTVLGAFHNGKIIGYGIVYPNNGDIAQLAIAREYRHQGAATTLLNRLRALIAPGISARLVNIENSDRASIEFLTHQGFDDFITQYEMHLGL